MAGRYWDSLCYINHHYKAVFPLQLYNFLKQTVTDEADREIANKAVFFRASQNDLALVMTEIKKFNK